MSELDASHPARFVDAYSSTTGNKRRVPAHWLEHDVLGKRWRKTPLQKVADKRTVEKQSTPAPAAGDDTDKEK